MSMLARYKKNNASMMELVKLVEESAEPKRSNLLNMVLKEDPEFGAKIQARLFDYAKIKTLDEGLIAEVIAAGTPKVLALSLHGETDENFIKLVEKCLGNKFSAYREEKENIADAPPNEAQVESARRKLVSEARKLEADGSIKLLDYDKIDAEIEGGGSGGAAALGQDASGGNDTPMGEATEESGVPSVESFGMEMPPAGLLGERFEAYVKKSLGL